MLKAWGSWALDFVRDPRRVFSPGSVDAATRRLIKCAWFGVAVWILLAVAGPTNVRSLELWLEDQQLAHDTAWGLTWASFLAFAMVRYAYLGSKITHPWPDIPALSWIRFPPLTVIVGGALVAGLLYVQLITAWNYYLAQQMQTTGGAAIARQASSDSVADAERALAEFEQRAARQMATVDAAIAATPEGSPTGRSRLVREQAALTASLAEERRTLQADLRSARAGNVEITQTMSDRRPVDGELAGAFGISRPLMASLNDLQRSGLIELLLVMGAGLALVGATAPARKHEDATEPDAGAAAEDPPHEEPAAEEEIADNVAQFSPRKRFLLPSATAEDLEEAA